ncbi:trypsin-like peptidase domain-containing protein [Pantoea sp. B65]|uniref:trypsin-like peptidase domain-containing protein n=1 Tax=Pantoea sp. B65 TaxID=2813359 RepID=UPI0039B55090
MKINLAVKLLSASILCALATGSLHAGGATPDGQATAAVAAPAKPLVKQLPPQNMLELLQADNVAQLRLRQTYHFDRNDPLCSLYHCDTEVISIAARFSQLVLSSGAYLEISSVADNEVLRYDASEIAVVTARYDGVFTTPYMMGNTITLRVVYPAGQLPAPEDSAVLDANLVSFNAYMPPNYAENRQPVACLQSGDSAQQQYVRGLATAYLNGSAWLVGSDNNLITTASVLGHDIYDGETTGDLIPERRVRFNYASPDCAENKAVAARDNLVNIKGGKIIASGGWESQYDWTLFSLDPLEYREAGIKSLFGGLAMEHENLSAGQTLSAIGHGRDGIYLMDSAVADPQQGTAKQLSAKGPEGDPCKLVQLFSSQLLETDCYLTAGNGGSPLLSADGKVIGLIYGAYGYSSYAIQSPYLLAALSQWAPAGEFGKATAGSGHVQTASIDFPAFSKPGEFTFSAGHLSFAPVVEGRKFVHFADYSQLKSVARDNAGRDVEVLFRLAQSNACGETSLQSVCDLPGPTTLKVWIEREDNHAIAAGQHLSGWLPVAVAANGKLHTNQLLRYRYSGYDPQVSPFDAAQPVLKRTIGNDTQYLHLFSRDNFRSGMTAVRTGEGPLVDNLAGSASDGVAYAGMTDLFAGVINQQDGKSYVIRLRAGLINTCTAISQPSGNWTPVNSAACEQGRPGYQDFSDGSVYLLDQDNAHLPAGRYSGLLPLMIRHWDQPDNTQAVELTIDYLKK